MTAAFEPIKRARRYVPRASPVVRAKVTHTHWQKRRIEIFIPKVVYDALGWRLGGKILAKISRSDTARLALSTSHSGIRLTTPTKKTTTGRLSIYGDFIAKGICARMRPLEYRAVDGGLIVDLPSDWVAHAEAQS